MSESDYVTFDPKTPKHKPVLSKILIAFILLAFLIEIFFSALYSDKAIIILGAKWNPGITHGEYWRFLTCTFLHGGLLHLFLNVAALYIFGQEVESIYGTFRFLLLYLICSWGSSLTSYAFSPHIAIGASGVIFGIIGSLIIFFYRQREKVTGANLKFKSMYTLVIINLLFGFFLPRVDNSAHIGGLITGLITSWFISPEYTIQKNKELERIFVVKKSDKFRLCLGIIIIVSVLILLTKLSVSLELQTTG